MINEYRISYWARDYIIVAKTQKSMLIRRLLIDAPKAEKERRVASKPDANGSYRSVTEQTQNHLFQELKNTLIFR